MSLTDVFKYDYLSNDRRSVAIQYAIDFNLNKKVITVDTLLDQAKKIEKYLEGDRND